MLKKLFGVVAVTTMALVASVSIASAQEYPPPENEIRAINNPSLEYRQNGRAVFQAECFLPGSTVTFSLNGTVLGTAVANGNGVATITTTIPAGTPLGAASVQATGTGCDGEPLTLVLGITIVRAQAPPAGELPRTGSSSSLPLAQIAVASIVAGGFLVIMTNRRRTVATVRSSSKG